VPVLAASAAYAIGEVLGFHVGLTRKPGRAPTFYAVLTAAGAVGVLLNFVHIDPIKALFWSAVINGVAAVPIMAMIMHLAGHRPAMGDFRLPLLLNVTGWISTAVMAVAAFGMFATIS
jgi:Mn2+/Fe2+ NRAMP family transporter